jgi:hypothetical protein
MFSDRNEWVIELNQHRMLFFNYEFFVELFKYVSMDPVVSKKYIVKWVESMIKNKIKDSYEINDCNDLGKVVLLAEEINLEGIRGVLEINNFFKRGFDDAIQDGVKLT